MTPTTVHPDFTTLSIPQQRKVLDAYADISRTIHSWLINRHTTERAQVYHFQLAVTTGKDNISEQGIICLAFSLAKDFNLRVIPIDWAPLAGINQQQGFLLTEED